jgi:hypothetical protein
VSAVAPDENAFRIKNRLSGAVASSGRFAVAACGHSLRHRKKPTPSRRYTIATNP